MSQASYHCSTLQCRGTLSARLDSTLVVRDRVRDAVEAAFEPDESQLAGDDPWTRTTCVLSFSGRHRRDAARQAARVSRYATTIVKLRRVFRARHTAAVTMLQLGSGRARNRTAVRETPRTDLAHVCSRLQGNRRPLAPGGRRLHHRQSLSYEATATRCPARVMTPASYSSSSRTSVTQAAA